MKNRQFSTLEVLGAGVLCAAMSWCLYVVRPWNRYFWPLVFLAGCGSLLLLAASHGGKANRRWLGMGVALLLPSFLLTPVLSSFALLWSNLLHIVATPFLGAGKSVRRKAWISASCHTTAFVLVAIGATTQVRQLEEMKENNPLELISTRLAYEESGTDGLAPAVSAEIAANIDQLAEWSRFSRRSSALRQLHNQTYEEFIRAGGFGVGRMIRPRPGNLAVSPIRDIDFAEQTMPAGTDDGWEGIWGAPQREDVEHGHWLSALDFLDAAGFGYIPEFQEVAGFVEHAFHRPATEFFNPPCGECGEPQLTYQVRRLELVSLLKYDRPMVYVLDVLPRMDRIATEEIPLRELDEFEANALVQIREDCDVVTEPSAGGLRMLGALRAATQCLDCHTAHRGQLLGAFTYDLVEVRTPLTQGIQRPALARNASSAY